MFWRSLPIALALLLLVPPAAPAQVFTQIPGQPQTVAAPSAPGYVVTGRVVCADTQRPARFATVMLMPASGGGEIQQGGRVSMGRTDLDGRFAIANVPAGDYYGTAQLTGYVNEAPAVRIALSQGGDAMNTIAAVPRLQVAAGGGSLQMSLERGGVLSGTVQWDDGSPAAGIFLGAQPPSSNASQAGGQIRVGRGRWQGFGLGTMSDDRGRFRIGGLPPGSYILQAVLQAPLSNPAEPAQFDRTISVFVYGPDKMRRPDAAIFTLNAGEERSDVNLVLNLAGLHTVFGQVSSSSAPVRSGSVLMTDQRDGTLTRRGNINQDGSFAVPYLPPGTYTLQVNASTRLPFRSGEAPVASPTVRFQPMQETVTITDSDLSGLQLNVNAASPAQ